MASSRPSGVQLSGLSRPPPIYTTAPLGSATRVDVPPGQPSLSSGTTARGSAYSPTATAVSPPPPMTSKEALLAKFHDYDDAHVYKSIYEYALDENALNFVVQFGDSNAQVAYGLGEGDFRQLLQQPSETLMDGTAPIRWINIWNPSRQRKVVEAIGKHYNFSKRLIMSIWAWDMCKIELDRRKVAMRENAMHPSQHRPSDSNVIATAAAAAMSTVDLEGSKISAHSAGMSSISGHAPPMGNLKDIFDAENLATFKMMQETLNYTSMDQESKFVCVGANWLHLRPEYKSAKKVSLVPPKHWSWFVLCDDHTVISFHEAAYYDKAPRGQDEAHWKAMELESMRSNTLKVLRQLSKCGLEEDQHNFMQLTSIRQPTRASSNGLDGASNLFYYLFEDYSAAFSILNMSKMALDDISSRILRTADWKSHGDMSDIIPMLYKLNKELRQLKHLFANYKDVIGRLISNEAKISGDEVSVTERLSPKASTRFKRLQVQMQSLMIDTITDYLDEKKSLQYTYFNIMTQKDSHSTERLTRSATLLAKLSVFFLPISFMTSYFSVQIPHMSDSYTAQTYWASFAVIAGISFLSLFFFSKVLMFLSESLDHASERATRWTYEQMGWAQRKKMRATKEEDDF